MSSSLHLACQEWQPRSVELGAVDLPRQLFRLRQCTHLADRQYRVLVERFRPLRYRSQVDAGCYGWRDWLNGLHHAQLGPGNGH